MHLLPGILGWALINVNSIYQAQLRLTGLPGRSLQYTWLIVFAFGWHLVTPVLLLRFKDKLTWKQTLEFLGLNRVDVRGLFVVLPVYCALFALAALPYMQWIWHPLEKWLQSVPAFHMPDYTIFKGGPEGLFVHLPATRTAVLVYRELLGRGTLLPWLPDEENSISGKRRMDRQLSTIRDLSLLADSPNLAARGLSSHDWLVNAASQGLVRHGRVSLLHKYVADLW